MYERFIGVALLVISSQLQATSFDCAKASTLVESAICSDPELSSLDDSLAALYTQTLRHSSSISQVKDSQRDWLKKRNQCKSEQCLKIAYQKRLKELRTPTATRTAKTTALLVRPGDCVDTQIVGKNTRFEGATPGEEGGEISVSLANNVSLYLSALPHLSQDINPNAYMARTMDFAEGDTVRLCLVSLPEDCPPGDDRGKIYSVTNLKNQMSFTGVDAWHSCGGA
jgi:uncharacterized protein YecT (DUF1311 family)